MFLSKKIIVESIDDLKKIHPFYGITFLACKKNELPIGSMQPFQMDSFTKQLLESYHKIDRDSDFYFQPYKSVKSWLRHDYPASGLQAINTQTFSPAFVHEHNSRLWAWANDYVEFLLSKLPKKTKIPIFSIACWVFKFESMEKVSSPQKLIDRFTYEFNISDNEKILFDWKCPSSAEWRQMLSDELVTWAQLRNDIESPPDAKPDQGGTLSNLRLKGLGPADNLFLKPAQRLSLMTGDNGLGKTFVLECAWWALTGVWAGRPAFPKALDHNSKAEITFSIEGQNHKASEKTIQFDWKSLSWPEPRNRPTISGLIVYARVDGSFAVWDPAQHYKKVGNSQSVFSRAEVWDGMQGRIEGLIRDWVRWQNSKSPTFDLFKRVLHKLSPPDLGLLEPGLPMRIPDDPRDIPTISHPHGLTPIVYASAGVKRIITLAYLIVWAWSEHLVAANLSKSQPQKRMVVLVDEMEAHLHPKWQREFLPALMSIGEMLGSEIEIQYLIATHSPLVLASAESFFDDEQDKLFHLNMKDGGSVSLEEMEFNRWGDISSWLTSSVFNLQHARSSQAEKTIELAKTLQLAESVTKEEVLSITSHLIKYLGPDDKFWPRWIAFAEKYGVEL